MEVEGHHQAHGPVYVEPGAYGFTGQVPTYTGGGRNQPGSSIFKQPSAFSYPREDPTHNPRLSFSPGLHNSASAPLGRSSFPNYTQYSQTLHQGWPQSQEQNIRAPARPAGPYNQLRKAKGPGANGALAATSIADGLRLLQNGLIPGGITFFSQEHQKAIFDHLYSGSFPQQAVGMINGIWHVQVNHTTGYPDPTAPPMTLTAYLQRVFPPPQQGGKRKSIRRIRGKKRKTNKRKTLRR